VQTLFPSHYSIRLATTQDYAAFFAEEMHFRTAMQYPPVLAMVNVVVRGRTLDEALEGAGALARRARALAGAGVTVLGPAPAPLARLRGAYRAQCFLKGTSRPVLGAAVREAARALPALAKRLIVDVDPLTVL
jgi:primosomal protein N' (replication factor Y)